MLVAIIRIIFGFAAAVLAAGAVQVLFISGLDDLIGGNFDAISARLEGLGLLMLLAATQSAVFAAPFAFLAAAVAAWHPLRSVLYFATVGVLIALAGFLAQYAGEAGTQTILNRYALAAYVASGLAGGLCYWFVAVPKVRPAASEAPA